MFVVSRCSVLVGEGGMPMGDELIGGIIILNACSLTQFHRVLSLCPTIPRPCLEYRGTRRSKVTWKGEG